jgi:hypothetical protein
MREGVFHLINQLLTLTRLKSYSCRGSFLFRVVFSWIVFHTCFVLFGVVSWIAFFLGINEPRIHTKYQNEVAKRAVSYSTSSEVSDQSLASITAS